MRKRLTNSGFTRATTRRYMINLGAEESRLPVSGHHGQTDADILYWNSDKVAGVTEIKGPATDAAGQAEIVREWTSLVREVALDPPDVAPAPDHPRRSLEVAAVLLPRSEREERLDEWLDHIACECESGGNPRRVVWSIVFRSLLPAIISARLRRSPARPEPTR